MISFFNRLKWYSSSYFTVGKFPTTIKPNQQGEVYNILDRQSISFFEAIKKNKKKCAMTNVICNYSAHSGLLAKNIFIIFR